MAQRAGAAITEVEGSHVIMISQPQAVTDGYGFLSLFGEPPGASPSCQGDPLVTQPQPGPNPQANKASRISERRSLTAEW